jgi:hypothetical protein
LFERSEFPRRPEPASLGALKQMACGADRLPGCGRVGGTIYMHAGSWRLRLGLTTISDGQINDFDFDFDFDIRTMHTRAAYRLSEE